MSSTLAADDRGGNGLGDKGVRGDAGARVSHVFVFGGGGGGAARGVGGGGQHSIRLRSLCFIPGVFLYGIFFSFFFVLYLVSVTYRKKRSRRTEYFHSTASISCDRGLTLHKSKASRLEPYYGMMYHRIV